MNWIKKLTSARNVAFTLIAVGTGSALTIAPPTPNSLVSSAEARIGGRSRGGGFGGGSFGSRGSRSFDGGQGTTRMQPLPSTQGRDPLAGGARTSAGRNGAGANRGSWLSRNPMLGMIGAALAGTVLGSLLMNAFGGMGSFGPILMMLLFGGLLFAIVKMFMNRKQVATAGNAPRTPVRDIPSARQTPYSAPNQTTQSRQEYLDNAAMDAPSSYNTGQNTGYGAPSGYDSNVNTQTRDQGLAAITLGDPTMTRERLTDSLSSRFFQIQEAWSQGDRQTLNQTLTGELNQQFGSDLSDMERRGERNILKNIVIRGFDISEAWQEGNNEFVTAHITARLLDYTEKNGQIIDGDAKNPTNFSEFWTFVRLRGRGEWILSAINQEA